MFAFYPEEPEYIYQHNPQSSRCRYHNRPSCSYHSNPYSSYSHPCSDSYFYPSRNNSSYYRNCDSPFYYRNDNRQDTNDESAFSNSSRQRDSLFNLENLFNVQPNYIDLERMSRRPQGHKSRNHGDELKKDIPTLSSKPTQIPKKSRSIPITTPEDSINNSVKVNNSKKVVLDKSQASKKIYKFLRYNTANHKTRNILSKLMNLRNIQNRLTNLESQDDQLTLTFSTEQEIPQVLPTSTDNKKFLEYEDTILKVLDKLDGIDSNGCDVVRERRREVVGLVQAMLNRLDKEKERQWEEFKMIKRKVEDNVLDNDTVDEKTENNVAVDDISENQTEVGVETAAEDIEVDEVENDITQSPAIVVSESLEDAEIKPYIISQADDVEKIDNALRDDTTKDSDIVDINSFVSVNTNESMDVMDVDAPFVENTESESSPFVGSADREEVSEEEEQNFDEGKKFDKKADDEFVMIESNDFN